MVSRDTVKTLLQAIVISWLDYGSQKIQNNAARLVCGASYKEHVTTDYYSYGEHCWVFLQICINFNTKWRASNTFEAHSGGPQIYLRPATGKHGHLHT